MNLEEESILSAYLDDELDSNDRVLVEAAMDADPFLRERFRSLKQGRNLLAEIARPTIPVDLSSSILSRIERSEPRFNLRRVYRGVLWGAAAASILVAGLLAHYSTPPPANLAVAIPPSSNPSLTHQPVANTDVAPALDPDLISSPKEASVKLVKSLPFTPFEDDLHRERLLKILDRPDLERVVIRVDSLNEKTLEKLDDVVHATTRKDSDYARLSMEQGSVVDPSLPESAELFVVTVDERERKDLLKVLGDHFPHIFDEGNVDPSVPALLADSGQVRLRPGQSAAGLIESSTNPSLAQKTQPDPSVPTRYAGSVPGKPQTVDLPIIDKADQSPRANAAPAPPPRKKITLILWATRRDSSH